MSDLALLEFMAKAVFVNSFQQSGPQGAVHGISTVDNGLGKPFFAISWNIAGTHTPIVSRVPVLFQ